MRSYNITYDDIDLASAWYSARIKQDMPKEIFPKTGIAVYEAGQCLVVASCFFDRSTNVAVLGWCISNPKVTLMKRGRATKFALEEVVKYAKENGAKHLLTIFGCDSLNRSLARMGFKIGDEKVVQQYIYLGE